jgi:hypothetical protein
MTLRTSKGRSLSKVFFAEKAKLAWINKLYGNIRKSLDRLGDIIALDPRSLKPSNGISLYYDGSKANREKIEQVLDVKFENNKATVKFSRIVLDVTLLPNKMLMKEFARIEAERKAA